MRIQDREWIENLFLEKAEQEEEEQADGTTRPGIHKAVSILQFFHGANDMTVCQNTLDFPQFLGKVPMCIE